MKVLHVPYHFDQNKLGGTEIYVVSLIKELEKLGVQGIIAAPTENLKIKNSIHLGILVYLFEIDQESKIEYAYGQPDLIAAKNLIALIDELKPEIVHLHAKSAAINSEIMKTLKERGIKVIFTYHTPTVTCPRGTMLLFGEKPCDGKINLNRCTACLLNKHGIPKNTAKLMSLLPKDIEYISKRVFKHSKVKLALGLKKLIFLGQKETIKFLSHVDQIVAVCNWVKKVVLTNGIDEKKVTLNRQGLPYTEFVSNLDKKKISENHFVIKYFGRIDETKGVLELVNAIKEIHLPHLKFEIFGIVQDNDSRYYDKLQRAIKTDTRIELKNPVQPHKVLSEMSNAQLIAVPSRWLETGPLVVLEAFEVGVPVIGSNIGGIGELIEHGINGILVDGDSKEIWAEEIKKIINFNLQPQLAKNILPVRKMDIVASEIRELYFNA
jgi:glycosyltransferase involved in cell wall biosynthesis